MTKKEDNAVAAFLSRAGRKGAKQQKKKATKKQLSAWGKKGMKKRWGNE